jgi:hypothetical protein
LCNRAVVLWSASPPLFCSNAPVPGPYVDNATEAVLFSFAARISFRRRCSLFATGSLAFLLLLLLQDLWLLRRRLLLGARSDSTTCQKESRRREDQNTLLHRH